MEYTTNDIEVIGVVLDLSLRHGSNGKQNLDNVKQALIEFFRKNLDDDDVMYLYHPDIVETVNRIGAQVAAISNYKTDGWKFNLNFALKQTLFILASEPYEEKILLLVTDRLSETGFLKKLVALNDKDELGCRVICVDIGNNLPDVSFAKIVHVSDSSSLSFKEIIYGQVNICSADSCSE
jgi:hypothetical protein